LRDRGPYKCCICYGIFADNWALRSAVWHESFRFFHRLPYHFLSRHWFQLHHRDSSPGWRFHGP